MHCTASLKGLILIAYYLRMRHGKNLDLTWGEIDLKTSFIRRGRHCAKNKTGRVIPFIEYLQGMPRTINGGYVFGQSRRFNRKAYNKAVIAAGIVDLISTIFGIVQSTIFVLLGMITLASKKRLDTKQILH